MATLSCCLRVWLHYRARPNTTPSSPVLEVASLLAKVLVHVALLASIRDQGVGLQRAVAAS